MHTLSKRSTPIPTLYVKQAPATYYIRSVFTFARYMSPCLLVLEDIETIVTPATRSYFFNEVDGLENNDGIMMVASTNYLDRLDPGLTKRPSRFDRKYLFPLPNEKERELYAQFWRRKLKDKKDIKFPEKLCPAMAKITSEFSFAYMQEVFVSTLLEMARRRTDGINSSYLEELDDDAGDDLDQYELWTVFKQQVKALRQDMDTRGHQSDTFAPSTPLESSPPPNAEMISSIPSLPGAFHMPDPPHRIINFPIRPKQDLEHDLEAQTFLSRFDKKLFRNTASDEYRPFDDQLYYAKRS
jgi:SpoVK/Ycf46/Vps4 family AAA+-type ATPase